MTEPTPAEALVPTPPAGPTVDLVAVAREALRTVMADPLVFVGAGVLLWAGSFLTASILTGPLLVGFVRLTERHRAGKPIDFVHLGLGFKNASAPILGWLVYVLAVALWLAVFVLPGLFVGIAWMFAFWFMACDDVLASDGLKRSWKLFANAPGTCVIIALTVILTNLIGSLTIVGILLSVPVSLVFMTLCFHGLTQAATLGSGSTNEHRDQR